MKLYWFIRYFVYKLRRQLGFKTKWEKKDPQATSILPWEGCMAMMRYNDLKRQTGAEISPIIFMIIDDWRQAINKLRDSAQT